MIMYQECKYLPYNDCHKKSNENKEVGIGILKVG